MFSFGEDEDDNFIHSIKPLPENAIERSAFTAKEFDPDVFLTSRRHLGLERMKTELNAHLRRLKAELVELINRDYQDFINLSTNLKGVDRNIESLKSPLANMEIEVKEVRNHFQKVIDDLEARLGYRSQLRDRKAVLKLLLNIHSSITKVEDLLGINTDIIKTKLDNTENDNNYLGKGIERVAIEYNQMQHLVHRGKDLDFVIENEWRITRIRDTIEEKLSKALSAALSQIRLGEVTRTTKQSLSQCLRTYAMIDQTQTAEEIIKEEFVKPFATKTITQRALEEGLCNHDNSLTVMYNKILAFASNDLQPILNVTQKTLKGSNYNVLVNSLWIEIIERIDKECKSIFAAGQTDIFYKNYSATIEFISELEGLCSSKKSLFYFRNHASYHEFMKRWQLPVYFQLRFHEIVKDIEDVLNNPKQNLALDNTENVSEDDFILPEGKAIMEAINQCWSDGVFLYGLSHKFWKLTLQLIKRYQAWILDAIKKTEDYKVQDEYISYLIALTHDIETFIKQVQLQANKSILPKLPLNLQDLPLLKETIEDVLNQLHKATMPSINEKIINYILQHCLETFKNKEFTAEAFIPNTFKPLHYVIKQNKNSVKTEWINLVVNEIINEYSNRVKDQTIDKHKIALNIKEIEDEVIMQV
ncbi:oligomeric golgi complex component, COG2-domain-containing protein [Cokeromyces recurvatus]|uniref:oligomeric golgi complex component, COG2-domain-containing protein n=1 Tax=Cokeromyces recurvatus TaxID=90255 RepID=UPI0022208F04|nr:oligomeric golgi complex component, COG2-domain-containing protein [Cokeromyces recurvatus]KAI7904429.1 oligomeric golgi complex component, COG2-domain-containing protein [Cokeromyces recurvatus]